MKVSENLKLIGISMLFVVGLVACGKQGSTATTASKSSSTLDQHAKDLIAQIKAKARNRDVTGGKWYPGDGVEIAPNAEFVYFTDRFGEKPFCEVAFTGINARDGSKWDLELVTDSRNTVQAVLSKSFFGPKNAIRLVLDGTVNDAGSPLQLGSPDFYGDSMGLMLSYKGSLLNDNAMDRLMRAKKVTLNHGMAGTSKVEYIFDTSSFPLAVQLSDALCLM